MPPALKQLPPADFLFLGSSSSLLQIRATAVGAQEVTLTAPFYCSPPYLWQYGVPLLIDEENYRRFVTPRQSYLRQREFL
jgi:hypothetical protein